MGDAVANLLLGDAGIAEEEAGTQDFADTVSSEDWLRRVSSSRFAAEAPPGTKVGVANVKGKKLVRAGVAVADDGTIAAAMVAGDMHVSPPEAMERLAQALLGGNAGDREDVLARVRTVFDEAGFDQPDAAAGITPDDVVEAVLRAGKAAA